jgi:uncharacterized coiled-coil protein SlyX
LQRETTYSQLLNTVNESDSKIEKLKRVNDELNIRLHELQANEGSSQDKSATIESGQNGELVELRTGIDETSARLSQLNERFKKINIVNDQVKTWCTRIWTKFAQMTEEEVLRQENQDMLV